MTTEALKEHISQLREWVTGPRQGMGSGLHAEKWPPLPLGARAMLAEHVMWLEQALAELEAAQQWRPMETAPRGRERVLLLTTCAGWSGECWWDDISHNWSCPWTVFPESQAYAWLPLPEPPKESV